MKVLDVPLYLQHPKSAYCVPYGLTGIAHFYGIKVTKEEMIEALKCHKKQGTTTPNIAVGAKKFGLKLERIKFNYENIKLSIEAESPVVLCHYYEVLSGNFDAHFTTIISAREDKRGMSWYLLNDTYFGRYEIAYPMLNLMWHLNGSWTRKVTKTNNERK